MNGLIDASLVFVHGGVDELIDALCHVFEEGGIIVCFVLPAQGHGRVLMNRRCV